MEPLNYEERTADTSEKGSQELLQIFVSFSRHSERADKTFNI